MARGERLSVVELVEDDALDAPAPAAGSTPSDAGGVPSRRRRRPALVVGGAVVLAVVGLGAVQSVADARARQVDARIAALPGALAEVGDSLEPLWTPDGDWWPTVTSHGVGAGTVLQADGSLALVGRDVETGQERWSTTVAPAVPGTPVGDVRCVPPEGQDAVEPGTVVCFATDAVQSYGLLDGADRSSPGTWSRLTVVDLRDGTVRATQDLDEPALHAAVLEDVTALVRLDAAGHLVVTAVDPLTGAEVWRYRHPERVPGSDDERWLYAGESAGHAMVQTASGVLVIDPEGVLRDDLDRAETWAGPFLQVPRDGRTVVVRAGRPDLEIVGDLAVRRLDDGSAPGLDVSSAAGWVYGWDGDTGEQRWEVELDAGQVWSVLVADGRVHLATRTGVVTLDARTGQVLWSFDLAPGSTPTQLLTDGPHVLVEQADPTGVDPSVLVVLDRRTGAHVRDVSLPTGVQGVMPFGHRLLAYATEPVVLG